MNRLSCNDLIGLQYGWNCKPGDDSGKTDCFQLVCEVRRRLKLKDYQQQFAWVYKHYTDASFPRARIARWLLQYGTRLKEPRVGAVILLPAAASGAALGTILEDGALFLSPVGMVIKAPLPSGVGHLFWMD